MEDVKNNIIKKYLFNKKNNNNLRRVFQAEPNTFVYETGSLPCRRRRIISIVLIN